MFESGSWIALKWTPNGRFAPFPQLQNIRLKSRRDLADLECAVGACRRKVKPAGSRLPRAATDEKFCPANNFLRQFSSRKEIGNLECSERESLAPRVGGVDQFNGGRHQTFPGEAQAPRTSPRGILARCPASPEHRSPARPPLLPPRFDCSHRRRSLLRRSLFRPSPIDGSAAPHGAGIVSAHSPRVRPVAADCSGHTVATPVIPRPLTGGQGFRSLSE